MLFLSMAILLLLVSCVNTISFASMDPTLMPNLSSSVILPDTHKATSSAPMDVSISNIEIDVSFLLEEYFAFATSKLDKFASVTSQ